MGENLFLAWLAASLSLRLRQGSFSLRWNQRRAGMGEDSKLAGDNGLGVVAISGVRGQGGGCFWRLSLLLMPAPWSSSGLVR